MITAPVENVAQPSMPIVATDVRPFSGPGQQAHRLRVRNKPSQSSQIIGEELERAVVIYSGITEYLGNSLERVIRGKAVKILQAAPMIEAMLAGLEREPVATLALAALTRNSRYELSHGINSAVYALNLGRMLGFSHTKLMTLGLASLHHDLGKARLSSEILGKPGPLSFWEYAMVKRHTLTGCKLMAGAGPIVTAAKEAVLQHHERFDGQGYPHGIPDRMASGPSRALALADAFDALVSERPHQAAKPATTALGIIWRDAGTSYHPSWAAWFVRSLSVYPPGSVVRLSDGSAAVVRRPDTKNPLTPEVVKLCDANLERVRPEAVDLAEGDLKVVRAAAPEKLGMSRAEVLTAMIKAT
jgi:HD-GYP domain-containing protein (c-di-GMP phosphodiesterase class II)